MAFLGTVGGTKVRSGRQCVERGVTARTNVRKFFRNGSGHLQDPSAGMADESARYLKEPPAHRGDAMPLPAIPQSGVLEEDEEIVGDDADPEKCGIGVFLTTGHPFHTKADFEFLDVILGMLTPLAIPDQRISGTVATIAGDDVVTGPVLFQDSP